MELSRRILVNIARQFGVEPGHIGKEKLRKSILEKIRKVEEDRKREIREANSTMDTTEQEGEG